jgi:hypothetical protein
MFMAIPAGDSTGTAGFHQGDRNCLVSFTASAVRNPPLNDSIGANRDRIQVVKGWLDRRGELQEKVYDVVWSDKRTPGADGKLLAVGNTVEVPNATYSNSIGDPELITVWRGQDFDAGLRAFYHARVIEIPTPRCHLHRLTKNLVLRGFLSQQALQLPDLLQCIAQLGSGQPCKEMSTNGRLVLYHLRRHAALTSTC